MMKRQVIGILAWIDARIFRHRWSWYCNWVWDLELTYLPYPGEALGDNEQSS